MVVCSTTGDGATPDNMKTIYRSLLRKSLPAGWLSAVRFAIFGLGDSNLLLDRQTTSAKDCNACAQRLDKRLIGLGATRWCAYGETDERTGNAEVQPWLAALGAAAANYRRELAAAAAGGGEGDDDAGNAAERSRAEAKAARAAAEEAEKAEKARIDALAAKWL